VFFSCCMLVISASVVFTVLILNLHFRGPDTHEMSPIMHKVFLEWLPWILCMPRPGYTFIRGVAIADELPLKPKFERLPIDDFPTTNPVIEAQLALLHKVYDQVSEVCAR
ncbi:acetylcholine receptor subunit alpha-type acr-16, partial [Trichostrongylus colubriformis]